MSANANSPAPAIRSDSFYRTQPNREGGEQVSIAVTIRSYGLRWSDVRDYLKQTVKVEELHNSQILEDTFIVYLPRDLTKSEHDHINSMRVVDPRQKKRIEERRDQRPVRPLDEFDT